MNVLAACPRAPDSPRPVWPQTTALYLLHGIPRHDLDIEVFKVDGVKVPAADEVCEPRSCSPRAQGEACVTVSQYGRGGSIPLRGQHEDVHAEVLTRRLEGRLKLLPALDLNGPYGKPKPSKGLLRHPGGRRTRHPRRHGQHTLRLTTSRAVK